MSIAVADPGDHPSRPSKKFMKEMVTEGSRIDFMFLYPPSPSYSAAGSAAELKYKIQDV